MHARRRLRPALLAAAAAALLAAVLAAAQGSGGLSMLNRLEAAALDLRFRLLAATPAEPRVVLVLVDHEALTRDGSDFWPWPRFFYGQLARYLRKAGARAVFFDFDFSGESVYSRFQVDMDEQFGAEGDDDGLFAQAASEAGQVYLALLFSDTLPENVTVSVAVLPEDMADAALDVPGAERLRLRPYASVIAPRKTIRAGAAGAGSVVAEPDADGVIRRVPLLLRAGERVFPSSHLLMARALWGGGEVRVDDRGALQVAGHRVPIDRRGHMALWWYDPGASYLAEHAYSAGRILEAAFLDAFGQDPGLDVSPLKDKVVLVGSNVPGLYDLKASPFTSDTPGVVANAVALENLLAGEHPVVPPAWVQGAAMAALAAAVAFAAVLAAHVTGATAAFAAGLALVLAAAWFLFAHKLVLWVATPALGLAGAYMLALVLSYWTEGRQRRQIKHAFAHYLAPAVVDQVTDDPARLRLGGDRREVTVYFSDVAGFTSISEAMEPEALVSLLNEYLTAMTDIVLAHDGTLDKYVGDAIMAFWGAPLEQPDHAVQACLTALDCHRKLGELAKALHQRGLPLLHARAGVNTGPVVVGNMGSARRFSYTVMGDTVNLAARLEPANKTYGTALMISEFTREQAGAAIEVRELDLLRVKGKAKPVRVYELLAAAGNLPADDRAWVDAFDGALGDYRERRWDRALAGFRRVLELHPEDGPAIAYLQRCRHFQAEPPPESWDGVYEMKTK